MKVAVAKYPVGQPRDFSAFAEKQTQLLQQAADAGARIAVLPEYLSLELAATFPVAISADLIASLEATQQYAEDFRHLYSTLAQRLGLHVVAGSFLTAVGNGRYRNRSHWFTPDGRQVWQDKLQLTAFEKHTQVIESVSICYDAEFPLPVRAQQQAGARLLAVPSCTDTDAGATRVRVGCLARALENRIFVAQSVTAGIARWSPALDENTGEAALFAPMDVGLPADGVVAQTVGQQVWAIGELDFDALEASRAQAQVANDRDWMGQDAPAIRRARLESFS
jgi:predicted amidohydrolase